MRNVIHETLGCGMECGIFPLPDRHLVAFQFRVLVGVADEPVEALGLARLVEETLDKGTQTKTAQEIADAFDAIGAGRQSGTGRETMTFTCTVLPEHLTRAVELHAELLRQPTFPAEMVRIGVELTQQELIALEDDAQAVMDKLISREAYGPTLGRHPLGEKATLERIGRNDLESFWRGHFQAGRMITTVAGPVDGKSALGLLEKHFGGFGSASWAGREPHPIRFHAATKHHPKQLEQEHIALCFPGVEATHDDFPVQQVTLGILSGGMSGRLFTEVREKRALVYWVGAWQETPRGAGMIFLGASTTPERCDQTYETLLREVDRLAEDLTEDELERAITGIVAGQETRGDSTTARCGELAGDLFFFGRPVPVEEKLGKVQRVTIGDVRRYLHEHPRDRLCVMTLGPRPLAAAAAAGEALGSVRGT